MDNLTKTQRSFNMSKIRSLNTKIEKAFRSLLYKNGYFKYTINNKKITGNPDIFFPKKKLAIFIDGCFWHGCKKCFKKPKSNLEYWHKKISRNLLRDKEINKKLKKEKIKFLRFWGHEIKNNLLSCFKKFKNTYEKI
ncbi:MAG: very short patch repair endonuclease [Patescibacteria group bacterium]|nr:very short patch repair endonuclease [Patescibacteria group bacterium]